ncbi:hypothetical protein Xenpb_00845 [Xenorhabdus sp. PB62.4]|nr:hypothetical protein [Xenorhabdus sp. PB62.4]
MGEFCDYIVVKQILVSSFKNLLITKLNFSLIFVTGIRLLVSSI